MDLNSAMSATKKAPKAATADSWAHFTVSRAVRADVFAASAASSPAAAERTAAAAAVTPAVAEVSAAFAARTDAPAEVSAATVERAASSVCFFTALIVSSWRACSCFASSPASSLRTMAAASLIIAMVGAKAFICAGFASSALAWASIHSGPSSRAFANACSRLQSARCCSAIEISIFRVARILAHGGPIV